MAHLALLSLLLPLIRGVAQARVAEVVEVRTLLTDEWGVPRPTGLTYFPEEGSLLVAGPDGQKTKVLRLSPYEDALGTLRLPEVSHPATLAYDPTARRLTTISGNELLTIPAADLAKERPHVGRINVANLGVKSPAGATFFADTGAWYVLDNKAKVIVKVPMRGGSPRKPSRISLRGLNAPRLQGLAFNPSDGLFYVASPQQDLLYGVDASGMVQVTYGLETIEFEGAGLQDLRSLVFAPSSDATDDPGIQHLFIADAGGSSTFGGVVEVLTRVRTGHGPASSKET